MRTLFTILCFGIYFTALSQKETHQWFLQGIRISVSPDGITNLPTLNSNIFIPYNYFPASTSVSDDSGNLLFAKGYSSPFNDYLRIEMIRQKIKNFTFKAFIGTDHNYFPLKANGETNYDIFIGTKLPTIGKSG